MTDIAFVWDNNAGQGHGDWDFNTSDLLTTSGIGDLENAIAISLFTDARCPDSFTPPDGDRKGTWLDSYMPSPIGSLLWTLERGIKSGETGLLLQARDYARQALQWLIDDGVVADVAVSANWITRNAIGISVTVTEPTPLAGQPFRFSYAWSSANPPIAIANRTEALDSTFVLDFSRIF